MDAATERVTLRPCLVPDCPCFAKPGADYCGPHQTLVQPVEQHDARRRPVLVRDEDGTVVRILV